MSNMFVIIKLAISWCYIYIYIHSTIITRNIYTDKLPLIYSDLCLKPIFEKPTLCRE